MDKNIVLMNIWYFLAEFHIFKRLYKNIFSDSTINQKPALNYSKATSIMETILGKTFLESLSDMLRRCPNLQKAILLLWSLPFSSGSV